MNLEAQNVIKDQQKFLEYRNHKKTGTLLIFYLIRFEIDFGQFTFHISVKIQLIANNQLIDWPIPIN